MKQRASRNARGEDGKPRDDIEVPFHSSCGTGSGGPGGGRGALDIQDTKWNSPCSMHIQPNTKLKSIGDRGRRREEEETHTQRRRHRLPTTTKTMDGNKFIMVWKGKYRWKTSIFLSHVMNYFPLCRRCQQEKKMTCVKCGISIVCRDSSGN